MLGAQYPPYVVTDEQKRRWAMAAEMAQGMFGDVDGANVWSATRAIYNGPWPTDDADITPAADGSDSGPTEPGV